MMVDAVDERDRKLISGARTLINRGWRVVNGDPAEHAWYGRNCQCVSVERCRYCSLTDALRVGSAAIDTIVDLRAELAEKTALIEKLTADLHWYQREASSRSIVANEREREKP